MQDGVRDRTKWVCSYAIARLAELALRDQAAAQTEAP
jgi:hypothetical protein